MQLSEDCKQLKEQGDRLFSKRLPVMSHWQELAANFYPERADFTIQRSDGIDFAANLTTSYPLLARRSLADSFSSMLRPSGQDWFKIGTDRDNDDDLQGRAWLEQSSKIMRKAMYDRAALFVKATKEGDNDFATFGQCVLSCELSRHADSLLYRCWHLRDVVWQENESGKIAEVHRKWKPTARQLNTIFKGNVSEKVTEALDKNPHQEIDCRHIVIESEYYNGPKKWKTPYVSLFIDADNDWLLEEKGTYNPYYVIPRWQTVSGSQYAHSPATVVALPDARLLQAITLVLLEAGEKSVDPPIVAKREIFRQDIDLGAGGFVWADEFDGRIEDVLSPINIDKSGLQYGTHMQESVRDMISQAFYLNKISLPPQQGDMTATEIMQRVQEYIRGALPLFEPMEMEYNGAICEHTFDLLMRSGGFGPLNQIPQSVRGAQVQFKFESPLQQSADAQKAQIFEQTRAILAEAAAVDPIAVQMIDVKTALRDTLNGIRTPAKWLRTDDQLDQIAKQQAEKQQSAEILQNMGAAADVAQKMGVAGQAMTGAMSGQSQGTRGV